eukprot:scaffold163659_cov27-Prasinocladus_malaysianus.AAC.2
MWAVPSGQSSPVMIESGFPYSYLSAAATALCLLALARVEPGSATHAITDSIPVSGFEGCPCVTSGDQLPPLLSPEAAQAMLDASLPGADLSTYGVGCAVHDQIRPDCIPPPTPNLTICSLNINPVPEDCLAKPWEPPSWCFAPWCYIADSENCTVSYLRSETFEGYRSYRQAITTVFAFQN